jgi:hypothetical protein
MLSLSGLQNGCFWAFLCAVGVQVGCGQVEAQADILSTDAGSALDGNAIDAPVEQDAGAKASQDAQVSDSSVADTSNPCPIVDGGCTEGCLAAHGSRYGTGAKCLNKSILLLCYDQFETPPDQALPMMSPDQNCWMVFPQVKEFEEQGWKSVLASDGGCDLQAMLGAKTCS